MLKIGWVRYLDVLKRFRGKLVNSTASLLLKIFLTPNIFNKEFTWSTLFTSSNATDKVFLSTTLKLIFSDKALLFIVSVFSLVLIVTVSK